VNKKKLTDDTIFHLVFDDISVEFQFGLGSIVHQPSWLLEQKITRVLQGSPNMVQIDGPFPHQSFPEEQAHVEDPQIEEIFREADILYFAQKGMSFTPEEWRAIWAPGPWRGPISLRVLAARALSVRNMAYLTYEGRTTWVNSTENLYPNKLLTMVSLMSREQNPPPGFEAVQALIPQALDLYYTYGLKTKHRFKTVKPVLDFTDQIDKMMLRTSSGLVPGNKREVKLPDGSKLHINPRGKKFETLDAALIQLRELFVEGKIPLMTFATSFKGEMYHSQSALYNAEKFAKMRMKGRFFIIPNQVFLLLERVVNSVRMLIERTDMIRIGQAWTHGGMDVLMKVMGALPDQMADCPRIFAEGDVEKHDLCIRAILHDLYYSQSMNYVDRDLDPELYDLISVCIELLVDAAVSRVQHLLGPVWVRIQGTLASGLWETSMIGSFATSFLYWLWMTCVYDELTPEVQVEAWPIMTTLLKMVVYSDDHLNSIPNTEFVRTHFPYHSFVKWVRHWWGLNIRDIFLFTEYETITHNGYILRRGPCFLQYYAVKNPHEGPGQPQYLPWRPTPDIISRVAHGREPSHRTLLDLALSVIGHSYGTYASNLETYDILRILYGRLMTRFPAGVPLAQALQGRIDSSDMKKFMKSGITNDELLAGFPTLEVLKLKNVYDSSYHEKYYHFSNDWETSPAE